MLLSKQTLITISINYKKIPEEILQGFFYIKINAPINWQAAPKNKPQ